ncbi:Uncharacterized protein QTN25_004143 [Entamoeba marina]
MSNSWFPSFFKKNNVVEDVEEKDKFVYDDIIGRWVLESTKENNPKSCPPEMTISLPPIIDREFTYESHISNRRERYIDPFTHKIHECNPPVVQLQ